MYVYKFISNDDVIYVGKANSLQNRMSQHFRGNGHLPQDVYNSVDKVMYIDVGTKSNMDMLELYFINKYKPIHNTASKTDDIMTVEVNEDNLIWADYNEFECIDINKHKSYIKSYKVFQRDISEDMDIFEEGIMSILTRYLEQGSNRVTFNGESLSNKDLEHLAKLGTSKLKETLSKLRRKNLIATQGRGLGREIYVNPCWAFTGKDIEKATLDLFDIKY